MPGRIMTLLSILALPLSCAAHNKDKYNPARFPITAKVTASRVVQMPLDAAHLSVLESAAIGFANGMNGAGSSSAMSSMNCRPAGGVDGSVSCDVRTTELPRGTIRRTVPRAIIVMDVGDVEYTMMGRPLLDLGVYHVRWGKHGMDVLSYNAKHKPHIFTLWIVGERSLKPARRP
jgi:hypothetical protein